MRFKQYPVLGTFAIISLCIKLLIDGIAGPTTLSMPLWIAERRESYRLSISRWDGDDDGSMRGRSITIQKCDLIVLFCHDLESYASHLSENPNESFEAVNSSIKFRYDKAKNLLVIQAGKEPPFFYSLESKKSTYDGLNLGRQM
jgi:hypothetical protein